MKTVKLMMKPEKSGAENLCLGYKEIRLFFNLGPLGGKGNNGDLLIAEADGEVCIINSADVIWDILDAGAYSVELE